jgi:hypothetical protein
LTSMAHAKAKPMSRKVTCVDAKEMTMAPIIGPIAIALDQITLYLTNCLGASVEWAIPDSMDGHKIAHPNPSKIRITIKLTGAGVVE